MPKILDQVAFNSFSILFVCLFFQRASQIRSVPFTGDSSDSDSDCGDGLPSHARLAAPEDVFDGVFRGTGSAGGSASRNTNDTTRTTVTSSTSGEMSLSSPRGLMDSPRGLSQLKISSFSAKKHHNHLQQLQATNNTANCKKPAFASATTNKFGTKPMLISELFSYQVINLRMLPDIF